MNHWPRIFLLTFLSVPSGLQPARAATFPLPSPSTQLIGEVTYVTARYEDTLLDIARRHGLGYQELVLANPTIDPWLPGEGTQVLLPTRYLLPATPREGIVINRAEMRLYYYPKPRSGAVAEVITHPVGIGRVEWETPLAVTSVSAKVVDPTWYPPASIRAEHAQAEDPLPSAVPPGPDNPLGRFAMSLGLAGYLIHGSNKAYGVGMRVSHGCIRLYPEDIEALFASVPIGTPVRIINQPFKTGWADNVLYLEVHPPGADTKQPAIQDLTSLVRILVTATQDQPQYAVHWRRAEEIALKHTGIPQAIAGHETERALSVSNPKSPNTDARGGNIGS
nr:L,D-transpeptidase family protein [Gammaproteobacteria bacterium]